MISMMILDPKPDETKNLADCFRDLTAIHSDEKLELSVFPEAGRAEKALKEELLVHMAVLDVTMRNGLEMAKSLRRMKPEAEIMIVADMSVSPMKYMTPAIRAASLLLRPYPEEQLRSTCEEFFENSQTGEGKKERTFLVENSEGKTILPFSDIFYFEAREKKIFVRTRTMEYGIYDTMERLGETLPEEFFRCHRSFILNRSLIRQVKFSENLILMKDGIAVPLSRTYKNALKEYLNGTETV